MYISIVQERLPDYRVRFFEKLKDRAEAQGDVVELILPRDIVRESRLKRDSGYLDWAHKVGRISLQFRAFRATYMFCFWHLRKADVVVVEHANRHLLNYILLAARALIGGHRIYWWGHGANLQSSGSALDAVASRWKRSVTRWADGALAYTEGSAARFIDQGLSRQSVAVVNNSIDTSWVSSKNFGPHSMHCVFMGSLHEHKRLAFLIEAGDYLAQEVPGFKLSVIGSGDLEDDMLAAARTRSWLFLHPRASAIEKGTLLIDIGLFLDPGLVGLLAIDSLASGIPIVTCRDAKHSPEIEYLRHGISCVMVDAGATPVQYSRVVRRILESKTERTALHEGCKESAESFGLESMVDRFLSGLVCKG